MRDDVLMRFTDRVMNDAEFRTMARADLDGALREGGFDLNDDELSAVREFHRSASGLSDEELAGALTERGRQQYAS